MSPLFVRDLKEAKNSFVRISSLAAFVLAVREEWVLFNHIIN
jgi:hypothetical protein